MYFFDEVKQFCGTNSKSYTLTDPLSFHKFTVFGAWVGKSDNTVMSSYSYWDSISGEKNVAKYEPDITVAHPEPIVLTAEYELIYRIPRYTDSRRREHTVIKA